MTMRLWLAAVGLTAGLLAFSPAAARAQGVDIAFAEEVVPYHHRHLLFTPDDRHLIYHWGVNLVSAVIRGGHVPP